MSIKTECIRAKLRHLRRISISVESFIPAVASEYGLLYHMSRKLTRYRIHSYNTSIPFNEIDKLRRSFFNLRRAIDDHELIINETISRDNNLRLVIRLLELQAKYTLSTSRFRKIFNDTMIRPHEIYELCKLKGRYEMSYNYYEFLSCLTRRLARLLYATVVH
jgi:hypothetical protein